MILVVATRQTDGNGAKSCSAQVGDSQFKEFQ